jgi:hypothetical protein
MPVAGVIPRALAVIAALTLSANLGFTQDKPDFTDPGLSRLAPLTLTFHKPCRSNSPNDSYRVWRSCGIAARVEDRVVEREANRALRAINLVRVDDAIIAAAAAIRPSGLRSLGALHLATAQIFGHHFAGMVVYDRRPAAAGRDHGIIVWAPH